MAREFEHGLLLVGVGFGEATVAPAKSRLVSHRTQDPTHFTDPQLYLNREQRSLTPVYVSPGYREQPQELSERRFDGCRVAHMDASPLDGPNVHLGYGVDPGARLSTGGTEYGAGERMAEQAFTEGNKVAGSKIGEFVFVGVVAEGSSHTVEFIDVKQLLRVGYGEEVVDRLARPFRSFGGVHRSEPKRRMGGRTPFRRTHADPPAYRRPTPAWPMSQRG